MHWPRRQEVFGEEYLIHGQCQTRHQQAFPVKMPVVTAGTAHTGATVLSRPIALARRPFLGGRYSRNRTLESKTAGPGFSLQILDIYLSTAPYGAASRLANHSPWQADCLPHQQRGLTRRGLQKQTAKSDRLALVAAQWTMVTESKPSAVVGGISRWAIARMTSAGTMRERAALRPRQTSRGTSKKIASIRQP